MSEAPGQPLVVFSPYGSDGASTRVRAHQWLAHTGVRAEVHGFAGLPSHSPRRVFRHLPSVLAAELRSRRLASRRYDRVLIQREISPFSSGGVIEQVAKRSSLSVYDFDDALMRTPSSRRDMLWSKSESCLRAVRAVDRVIAGNDYLADWATQHNSDVRVIPTCVEPGDYRMKDDYFVGGTPRLVWIGSPSTERYLHCIADALLDVHRQSGARLTVISAGEASMGRLDPMVDRVPWVPGVESNLGAYDVAVAPLIDGSWERGKCAYKVLQYGAAGLPSVVSPVGANGPVSDDLGYPMADSIDSWADSLLDLLRAGPSERCSVGMGARAAVEAKYSYSSWAVEWLSAIGEPGY